MSWTTTDLLASIKSAALIPSSQNTFQTQDFLQAAHDQLLGKIVPLLMSIREEFYVTDYDYSITSNQTAYKIPARSIGQILRDVAYVGSETLVSVNTSGFTLGQIVGQALGTSMTTAGVVGVRIRITGVSSGNLYDLNNGFVVEQAMANYGLTAATFSRAGRNTQEELAMCQRYYARGDHSIYSNLRAYNSGNAAGMVTAFPVQMRAVPLLTVLDQAATANKISWSDNGGTMANGITPPTFTVGVAYFSVSAGGIGATSNGVMAIGGYRADAEI